MSRQENVIKDQCYYSTKTFVVGNQKNRLIEMILLSTQNKRLPLFGNGAGAYGIGKISGVLTEIGKFDIILMYEVSIARLIPIIKLTLVYYEKRERKKQVLL